MITVITGQPGAGKTALCVSMLEKFKGRPLVVMGIPELKVEHQPAPPVSEWVEFRKSPEDETLSLPYFLFPENAVVIIDEAQRVFRPRAVGSKVPPEVAAFETHRHTGIDFILLTQHPGLIDPNIRKLVGKHIHVRVTPFGRQLYEWTELGDPESSSSRELAARTSYRLPSKAFSLYKSAELHTKVSRKVPFYAWLFLAAVVLAVGLGWYGYNRISSKVSPSAGPPAVVPGTASSAPGKKDGAQPVKTTAQLVAAYTPRLEGLHHTAPAYDGITNPVDAPIPVGCVRNAKGCRCIDQQGNDYATTPAVCNGFIEHGMFIAWKKPQQGNQGAQVKAEKAAPKESPGADAVPGHPFELPPAQPPGASA